MTPVSTRLYVGVAEAAAEQWGLFTAAQARGLGATAQHLLSWSRRGLVQHETHGIYRITGAPEDLGLDGLRMAWLSTAPELWRHERPVPAVVSHLSAAHTIRRLGTAAPGKDHLTVCEPRRTRASHVRLHVDPSLSPADWEWVDGLPVTTLDRTLRDLHTDGMDGGHLGDIIRDALRAGVAARSLSAALDSVTAGRGRELLDRCLDQCGAPRSLAPASDLLNI